MRFFTLHVGKRATCRFHSTNVVKIQFETNSKGFVDLIIVISSMKVLKKCFIVLKVVVELLGVKSISFASETT